MQKYEVHEQEIMERVGLRRKGKKEKGEYKGQKLRVIRVCNQ